MSRVQDRASVELSNGYFVALEALLNVPPHMLARAVKLELDVFLAEVERWSELDGFMFGIRVDRELETIVQLGAS